MASPPTATADGKSPGKSPANPALKRISILKRTASLGLLEGLTPRSFRSRGVGKSKNSKTPRSGPRTPATARAPPTRAPMVGGESEAQKEFSKCIAAAMRPNPEEEREGLSKSDSKAHDRFQRSGSMDLRRTGSMDLTRAPDTNALLQQALSKALGIGYADPKKTFDSNPLRLPFRGHTFDSEHTFDTNPQRHSLRGQRAQDVLVSQSPRGRPEVEACNDIIDLEEGRGGEPMSLKGHEWVASLRDDWVPEGLDDYDEYEWRCDLPHIIQWYQFSPCLDPRGKVMSAWTCLLLLCITYNLIVVPLTATFLTMEPYHVSDGEKSFLTAAELLLDVIFLLDVVIIFNTYAYMGGVIIEDKIVLAQMYLRTWFAWDLVASLPIDWFLYVGGTDLRDTHWRLAACQRLLRVSTLVRVLEKWAASNTLRLMKMLACFVLFSHWMACGWGYVGYYMPESSASSPEYASWFEALKVSDEERGLPEPSLTRFYTVAFYWVVTTITSTGYGDILPITITEIRFTIAVEIFGGILFAAIFGNLAVLISSLDKAYERYQKHMESVAEFVKVNKLTEELKLRVVSYFDYMWTKDKGLETHLLMNQLPSGMAMDVYLHSFEKMIRAVPIFADAETSFIKALCPCLELQVVFTGDFLMYDGDMGHEMYFLQKGTVQVLSRDLNTVYAVVSATSFFGEIALLLGTRRTASVQALEISDVYKLTRVDFENAVGQFPGMREEFRATAQKRLEDNRKARIQRDSEDGGDDAQASTPNSSTGGRKVGRRSKPTARFSTSSGSAAVHRTMARTSSVVGPRAMSMTRSATMREKAEGRMAERRASLNSPLNRDAVAGRVSSALMQHEEQQDEALVLLREEFSHSQAGSPGRRRSIGSHAGASTASMDSDGSGRRRGRIRGFAAGQSPYSRTVPRSSDGSDAPSCSLEDMAQPQAPRHADAARAAFSRDALDNDRSRGAVSDVLNNDRSRGAFSFDAARDADSQFSDSVTRSRSPLSATTTGMRPRGGEGFADVESKSKPPSRGSTAQKLWNAIKPAGAGESSHRPHPHPSLARLSSHSSGRRLDHNSQQLVASGLRTARVSGNSGGRRRRSTNSPGDIPDNIPTFVDVFPTFADLVGAEPPRRPIGHSNTFNEGCQEQNPIHRPRQRAHSEGFSPPDGSQQVNHLNFNAAS